MAFQLLCSGLMKSEPLKQTDGSLIRHFDGGEKAGNPMGAGNMREHGLGSLRSVTATPMPAGKHKSDPSAVV